VRFDGWGGAEDARRSSKRAWNPTPTLSEGRARWRVGPRRRVGP
jgi:hypothetical protein